MRNREHRSEGLVLHFQRQAHERAAELARRVPWQVLLEARNQYLEWQEFYCWARSIMESEGSVPDWLARRLDEMCPGVVAGEKQWTAKRPKDAALAPVRLGEWIDAYIFAFAKKGGWPPAITFYAVREPRYQRAFILLVRMRGEMEEGKTSPISLSRSMASASDSLRRNCPPLTRDPQTTRMLHAR